MRNRTTRVGMFVLAAVIGLAMIQTAATNTAIPTTPAVMR